MFAHFHARALRCVMYVEKRGTQTIVRLVCDIVTKGRFLRAQPRPQIVTTPLRQPPRLTTLVQEGSVAAVSHCHGWW